MLNLLVQQANSRLYKVNHHGGEQVCVGGVGGKAHVFLMIWCVVCS